MASIQKSKLQIVKSRVSRPGQNNILFVDDKRLYVFFSVDICNSTKLKEAENWFKANRMLYSEQFDSMHFWKFNGDEVLYAEPLSNIESLIDIVHTAYTYLKFLQNELCREFGDSFRLKGTIWLAETGGDVASYHVRMSNLPDEFLGSNIERRGRSRHRPPPCRGRL